MLRKTRSGNTSGGTRKCCQEAESPCLTADVFLEEMIHDDTGAASHTALNKSKHKCGMCVSGVCVCVCLCATFLMYLQSPPGTHTRSGPSR